MVQYQSSVVQPFSNCTSCVPRRERTRFLNDFKGTKYDGFGFDYGSKILGACCLHFQLPGMTSGNKTDVLTVLLCFFIFRSFTETFEKNHLSRWLNRDDFQYDNLKYIRF